MVRRKKCFLIHPALIIKFGQKFSLALILLHECEHSTRATILLFFSIFELQLGLPISECCFYYSIPFFIKLYTVIPKLGGGERLQGGAAK